MNAFLIKNPKSTAGMDLSLEEMIPSQMEQLQAKAPEIRAAKAELAQSKYLVARAADGRGGPGLPARNSAGNYWLSSLELAAAVGDAHLRWDTPVSVRPGQPTYITLSNVNAVQPRTRHRPSSNSTGSDMTCCAGIALDPENAHQRAGRAGLARVASAPQASSFAAESRLSASRDPILAPRILTSQQASVLDALPVPR